MEHRLRLKTFHLPAAFRKARHVALLAVRDPKFEAAAKRLRDLAPEQAVPPGDQDPTNAARTAPHFPTDPIPLRLKVSFQLVSLGWFFLSTVRPTPQQSLRGLTVKPAEASVKYPLLRE